MLGKLMDVLKVVNLDSCSVEEMVDKKVVWLVDLTVDSRISMMAVLLVE